MIKVQRSAILAHSDKRMFELVNDVEAYPLYLDGCKAVKVLHRSDTELVARLTLSRGSVSQSFTTRNILDPVKSMTMTLEEGPFSHFNGLWQFKALNETACKVSLNLEFTVSNRVLAKAVEPLLKSVADQLVDSVCQRANKA